MLWGAVQSQWNIGFSGATGLNMTAVKVIAETLELEFDIKLLRHIQVLEGATLKYFSEQAKTTEKKGK